jgi:threonine dehydrogenase-like Zn-dependent dehydrogenase
VFALGPIGLMAVAGARLRGAGLVIGIDSVPKRQEWARFYGADLIVDFTRQDVVAQVMELTGGRGVDCAVEALGTEYSFQNAGKVTKPGGTISNVGYHGKGDFVGIPRLAWASAWRRKLSVRALRSRRPRST